MHPCLIISINLFKNKQTSNFWMIDIKRFLQKIKYLWITAVILLELKHINDYPVAICHRDSADSDISHKLHAETHAMNLFQVQALDSTEAAGLTPKCLFSFHRNFSISMSQQMQNLQLTQSKKGAGPASPSAAKRLYRNLSEKFKGSHSSFEDAYFFGRSDRIRKVSVSILNIKKNYWYILSYYFFTWDHQLTVPLLWCFFILSQAGRKIFSYHNFYIGWYQ